MTPASNQAQGATPGPWWVDAHCNVMSAGGLVAFPGISAGFDQAANAHLIAASPLMLSALRRAVLALAFAAETSPAMRDDYEAVSAAIAAATQGGAGASA